MTATRLSLLAAIAVTVAAVVVGWRVYEQQPDGGARPDPSPSATASASVSPSPSARPTPAELPPAPREGACYTLSYGDAVAPTTSRDPVPCHRPHTSVTYAVGTLDAVVAGHLATVDSGLVRQQVAQRCPALFADHVGGTPEQRRLSQLRPVGFTPTVEQSDRGAAWFRCDAVAVAGDNRLAPLGPGVAGVLDTEAGRRRYGLCATAEPGADSFRPVICSAGHAWRAVRTVPFSGADYPGEPVVRQAGTAPCRAAGRQSAADPLNFEWGYEWPTATRWREGRTYGICWVPD